MVGIEIVQQRQDGQRIDQAALSTLCEPYDDPGIGMSITPMSSASANAVDHKEIERRHSLLRCTVNVPPMLLHKPSRLLHATVPAFLPILHDINTHYFCS